MVDSGLTPQQQQGAYRVDYDDDDDGDDGDDDNDDDDEAPGSLVEETGAPEGNHRLYNQNIIHNARQRYSSVYLYNIHDACVYGYILYI